MSESRLSRLVDDAIAALRSFYQADHANDDLAGFRAATRRLFELYVAERRATIDEQRAEVDRFAATTEGMLGQIVQSVDRLLIPWLEDLIQSTWYADEWRTVCQQRSAIEALREMFRDSKQGRLLTRIDTEDLDDLIRDKGEREGFLAPGGIPPGIPPNHWWWWLPEEPPSAAQ